MSAWAIAAAANREHYSGAQTLQSGACGRMYGDQTISTGQIKNQATQGRLNNENTATIGMPASAITALQRMVAGGGGAQ